MCEKPFAEYADRNGEPILEVLTTEFVDASNILEIGSGTGQHAARFSAAMPHLQWQTSDLAENHAGIQAWVNESGRENLLPPLELDVRTATTTTRYDGVYSSNTAHIMSFDAVRSMFALVAAILDVGGRFCLYGPFRQDGEFNTPSNAAFHRSLLDRDTAMGIRDLEALDALGEEGALTRIRLYAMPANNHLAVWRKDVL